MKLQKNNRIKKEKSQISFLLHHLFMKQKKLVKQEK